MQRRENAMKQREARLAENVMCIHLLPTECMCYVGEESFSGPRVTGNSQTAADRAHPSCGGALTARTRMHLMQLVAGAAIH
jgi:hypothetical protein